MVDRVNAVKRSEPKLKNYLVFEQCPKVLFTQPKVQKWSFLACHTDRPTNKEPLSSAAVGSIKKENC